MKNKLHFLNYTYLLRSVSLQAASCKNPSIFGMWFSPCLPCKTKLLALWRFWSECHGGGWFKWSFSMGSFGFKASNLKKNIWPNGIIFHQPRFPWNKQFPETSATFGGQKGRVYCAITWPGVIGLVQMTFIFRSVDLKMSWEVCSDPK